MPAKKTQPLTRETLTKLIAFEAMKNPEASASWDDMCELQFAHMRQILALALVGFDRIVPPVSVEATERGVEIVVGFPPAATATEGHPWP